MAVTFGISFYLIYKSGIMQPIEIAGSDLLDILFEGRNKAYGAYELRRTYHQHIIKAMAGTVTIVIVFCVFNLLAQRHQNSAVAIPIKDVNLLHITEKPPIEPRPIIITPPKAVEVRTIQYVTPMIVADELVEIDVPELADIVDAKIGAVTNNTNQLENGFVTPPIETTTSATAVATGKMVDYDDNFTKIEKDAMFPGGLAGWRRYLERNLEANIAADEGASEGMYMVKLQFTVDIKGNISNVEVLEKPAACPGCAVEAIRVIKKGPKWEPAIQNGRAIIYQAVQIITFQVK